MALATSNMSANIERDSPTIANFPHSVYLAVHLYVCGASILNQAILLTAAHCLQDANSKGIIAFVGHNNNWLEGQQHQIASFKVHEKYRSKRIWNDICLLRLKKNLTFGSNVKKVILMQRPPYNEKAYVAGSDVTEVKGHLISDFVQSIIQKVYKRENCNEIGFKHLPIGTICGEHSKKQGHTESGASGSALIVRKSIQIGLVSFNRPLVSTTNTIYTDIGYFYDWIKSNAEKLYCRD